MTADHSSFDEEISRRLEELDRGEQGSRQWTDRIRQLWEEARNANVPGVSAEEVLDRLERKYQPMVEAIERDQGAIAADRIRTRLGQMKSVSLTPESLRNSGSE
jgi:hypothetical protein